MNLDSDFTSFPKINSKWTIGLNIKHKTITVLEDNIGRNLGDFEYGNDIIDTTRGMIQRRNN